MGLIETSVALAGCVLVLVVVIVLDRRIARGSSTLHSADGHRPRGHSGARAAPLRLLL